jgi:hypothetical protein
MELRILTWLFPWLMAAHEFLLRNSLHDAGAVAFIGPTVGGAALGMMLPFTRARELPKTDSETPNSIAFDRSDDHRAQLTNLILWIGLIAWAVCRHLSLMNGSDTLGDMDGERTSTFIGAIIWLIAVVLDWLRGGER